MLGCLLSLVCVTLFCVMSSNAWMSSFPGLCDFVLSHE